MGTIFQTQTLSRGANLEYWHLRGNRLLARNEKVVVQLSGWRGDLDDGRRELRWKRCGAEGSMRATGDSPCEVFKSGCLDG